MTLFSFAVPSAGCFLAFSSIHFLLALPSLSQALWRRHSKKRFNVPEAGRTFVGSDGPFPLNSSHLALPGLSV